MKSSPILLLELTISHRGNWIIYFTNYWPLLTKKIDLHNNVRCVKMKLSVTPLSKMLC
jgi:hypothetical protein